MCIGGFPGNLGETAVSTVISVFKVSPNPKSPSRPVALAEPRKKKQREGSRPRRGQTEAEADGRQLSERLIVPEKPGNSSREDPVKGSGRRL